MTASALTVGAVTEFGGWKSGKRVADRRLGSFELYKDWTDFWTGDQGEKKGEAIHKAGLDPTGDHFILIADSFQLRM